MAHATLALSICVEEEKIGSPGEIVNRPNLKYDNLVPEEIKKFHKENGGVLVELNSAQGKMLTSLLNQKDIVEKDLLFNASLFTLLWHNIVWSTYELKAFLFYRKLLDLQRYVKAVDASYGWEETGDGGQIFMLFPINKNRI